MAARGNYSRSSDRSRQDSVHDNDYDNYSDSFVSDDSADFRRKSRTKPAKKTVPKNQKQATNRGRNSKNTSKTTPRDMDAITKRVLSARRLKVNELRNQVEDLTLQMKDLKEENKILKRIQYKQEKALDKIEDRESNLPQLIQSHANDVRTLKDQNKRTRDKYEKTDRYLRDAEDELERLKQKLKRYKRIIQDKNLLERDELAQKVQNLEIDQEEKNTRIKELEKHLEHVTKNHKHELGIATARHRESLIRLQESENCKRDLEMQLKEKEKELDIRNIYSNHARQPPRLLPASYNGTPTPGQDSHRRTSSLTDPAPREKAKQYEAQRRQKMKQKMNQRQPKAITGGEDNSAWQENTRRREEEDRERRDDESRKDRENRERQDREEEDRRMGEERDRMKRQSEERARQEKNRQNEEDRYRREQEETNQWENERRERQGREERERQELEDQEREENERNWQRREEEQERLVREQREQFEREEREKRDRENRERREKEEQERREQERLEEERRRKEAFDNDAKAQEERRKKDALLARLRDIDDGKTKENQTTNFSQNYDTGSNTSTPTSKKSNYSFTKPIENLHNGKPSHEDNTLPYLEKQKRQRALVQDSEGYNPSFASNSASKNRRDSLEKDTPTKGKSKNKSNLLSDLFGKKEESSDPVVVDDGSGEDFFITRKKPEKAGTFPWDEDKSKPASNVASPSKRNENFQNKKPISDSPLIDDDDAKLLPRRPRHTSTFKAKPAVTAVDTFDDDLEEVIL